MKSIIHRDRYLGLAAVGEGDVVDGADGVPGAQHLVARNELSAVLEQQVVLAAAATAEQDHEHQHQADEESPAGGDPSGPSTAPGIHGLPFRRHRSRAARAPSFCETT